MKSAVENLTPTRAKLSVEVPFEELKPSLDAAYKKIAQQINIPGFRRGKVPPAVIDRQVGRAAVLDEAINEVLPQKYVEALQEHSLQPLAQPEIEVTKFEDHEVLEFTAEVDIRPEIEVPDYEGVEAEVEDIEITDTDVEEQVQALRERFATLNDVERPAAENDFVVLDLRAKKDGEVLEGAEVTGMSYQVGRGGMLDGLDEALTGMSAGEDKTFSSQLVGGDLVGEEVEVEVSVSQVQEQELPELDDDFAQLASEFDTVAELHEDVRTRLGRRQAPRAGRRRPRRGAREAARAGLRAAAGVAGHRRAQRPPPEHRAAARDGRHHDGQVPRGRGPDRRGVRGRPRPARPRGRDRAVHPRRDRQEGGARRRPVRALRAPRAARPAVRPGPAGVREPHVRAQPHPGPRPGDPARQGAGHDRGVRGRQGRLGQRGRAEEPAPRRQHRRGRAGRGGLHRRVRRSSPATSPATRSSRRTRRPRPERLGPPDRPTGTSRHGTARDAMRPGPCGQSGGHPSTHPYAWQA